jgi:hypothetical protein
MLTPYTLEFLKRRCPEEEMIRLINGPVADLFKGVWGFPFPCGEETGDERTPIYRQQLAVFDRILRRVDDTV